jgi:hypothetical protein
MRIVYMSGYTANAIDHQRMLDDGIEFLPKPIGLDTLVRKLREVLNGRERSSLAAAHAEGGRAPLARRLLGRPRPGLAPRKRGDGLERVGAHEVPHDLDPRPGGLGVHPRGRGRQVGPEQRR